MGHGGVSARFAFMVLHWADTPPFALGRFIRVRGHRPYDWLA